VVRAFRDSALPVMFLPGVIHLPTVPPHRKLNRIDLGTPDKLCVAAVALAGGATDACVVELGSAFTACLPGEGGWAVAGRRGWPGGYVGPVGLGQPRRVGRRAGLPDVPPRQGRPVRGRGRGGERGVGAGGPR